MAKKLPFWKFDIDDWLTGKIQLCDYTTQGVFINLCAMIWRGNGTLKNDKFLAMKLRLDEGTFNQCLTYLKEFEIIVEKDGFLSVKFLDKQLAKHKEFSKKMSESGKKSAAARQGRSTKKKGERRKEKEDIKRNQLKEKLVSNGWTGNFDKLMKEYGYDVINCYWNNCLEKDLIEISDQCKGGRITKKIKAEAVEFYHSFVASQKEAEAEKKAIKERQKLLINGEAKWSLLDPAEKQKLFEQVRNEMDLCGSVDPETWEISNPLIKENVYEKLAVQHQKPNTGGCFNGELKDNLELEK